MRAEHLSRMPRKPVAFVLTLVLAMGGVPAPSLAQAVAAQGGGEPRLVTGKGDGTLSELVASYAKDVSDAAGAHASQAELVEVLRERLEGVLPEDAGAAPSADTRSVTAPSATAPSEADCDTGGLDELARPSLLGQASTIEGANRAFMLVAQELGIESEAVFAVNDEQIGTKVHIGDEWIEVRMGSVLDARAASSAAAEGLVSTTVDRPTSLANGQSASTDEIDAGQNRGPEYENVSGDVPPASLRETSPRDTSEPASFVTGAEGDAEGAQNAASQSIPHAVLGNEGEAVLATQAASGAGYTWPLRVAGGPITNGFGGGHGGIDIPIGGGNEVLASMSGTVKYVHRYDGRTSLNDRTMNSYGNLVILYHPNGTTTYYAHMQDVLVSVGQTVSQGQVIGHVGLTGATTGYHLHFELRTGASPALNLSGQGTRQNPLDYVNASNIYEENVNHAPFGYLDIAAGGDGVVYVRGWACDPDDPGASIDVHIYFDGPAGTGTCAYILRADLPRDDVNSVIGVPGNHGFEATFETDRRGPAFPVFAHGIDLSGGHNPVLANSFDVAVGDPVRNAVTTLPEGRYAIRTKVLPTSGLDIEATSTDDMANAVLYHWGGVDNQKFDFIRNDDSTYTIVAAHSGKAVEVTYASASNGANVAQYSRNDTNAQKWYTESNPDGTWLLRCKASGLYLDLAYGDTTDLNNVQQYEGNGEEWQKWYLVPTDASQWDVNVGDQKYTGKAVRPKVEVKAGGVTLKSGTDYSVSYKNNVKAGTASVTVSGKNGYTGSKTATFKIEAPRPTPTPSPKPTPSNPTPSNPTPSNPTPKPAPTPRPARVEMHRLYNPYTGEHFYTANAGERDGLVAVGWTYEGVGWVAPESSGEPVFRLYNPYAGDHHYTTSASERDGLVAAGWADEGVGWRSAGEGGTPLYRQYNPYATVGTHNYTTSLEENGMLVSAGWIEEGIGWYGVA